MFFYKILLFSEEFSAKKAGHSLPGGTAPFVESTNGRLYLFYLPPYSPDLNPDEMVWRHLKCHHIGKKFISSQKELFRLVKNVLLSLQRTPRKIVGFYKKTYSDYAIL